MILKIILSIITRNLKKTFICIGFAWLNVAGFAQSAHHPLAARYTGMGAYSKNFADVMSISSNQAVLAGIKSTGAGIYAEKRFLSKELNLYNVSVCLPLQFGGLGISAKYFGYHYYNETQLGIGYGKNLGKIDIGIQFSYQSLRIPGYGKDGLINIEAGVILHVSEQLRAGVHVFNLTRSKFGRNNPEKLPSVYRVGLGYEASDKVFISMEFIKEEDKASNINAGLQYLFAKRFFGRLGLFTETTNLYFGIGLKWNIFRVDITSSYHPQLGITPGVMIVFQPNPDKE